MATEADILKNYLVAVGFKTDYASFTGVKTVLKDLEAKITEHTGAMTSNYVKAGTIIASSLASIAAATVTMIDHVTKADLSYQKFALQMYMTKQEAKGLKIAMDAMGESDLSNIAWIKELQDRYTLLRKEGRELEIQDGRGAEERLKSIKQYHTEYARMKQFLVYGMEGVVDNLLKMNVGPNKNLLDWFNEMNDYIKQHLPDITKKIATWLTTLYEGGKRVYETFKDMFVAASRFWTSLDDGQKSIATFAAAIGAFWLMGPVAQAVIVLTSLIYALSDFYKYIDGEKSNPQLAPFWDILLKLTKQLEIGFKASEKALVEFMNLFTKSKISDAELDDSPVLKFLRKLRAELIDARTLLVPLLPLLVAIGGAGGVVSFVTSFFDPEKAQNIKIWSSEMLRIAAKINPSTRNYETWIDAEGNVKGEPGRISAEAALARTAHRENSGKVDPNKLGPPTKHGFAKGSYQIMDANWSKWGQAIGLGKNALRTKENEDLISRYGYSQYLKEFNNNSQLADIAWINPGFARALYRGLLWPLDKSVGGPFKKTVRQAVKESSGIDYVDPTRQKIPLRILVDEATRQEMEAASMAKSKVAAVAAAPPSAVGIPQIQGWGTPGENTFSNPTSVSNANTVTDQSNKTVNMTINVAHATKEEAEKFPGYVEMSFEKFKDSRKTVEQRALNYGGN